MQAPLASGFTRRQWIGMAVAAFLVVLILSSIFVVREYERTVVTTMGKFSHVANPGINFKLPFVQGKTEYRIDRQSLSPDTKANKGFGVSTYTVDNQEVHVIFTIQYRILPEKIQFIFANLQDLEVRLYQICEDRLKAEMGKVNTSHVAERRGDIRNGIKEVLTIATTSFGIEILDFQLNNIEFDETFKKEVQKAAAARAGVEREENLRQQAEKIAAQKVIAAKGLGDAAREQAKGEADGIKLRGDATASAIRARAEALAANAKLVELTKAEKWDGKLPVQMLSGVVPFMNYEAAK